MEVLVPDDQLSLAIGKGGQNVRLAAKLLGWKVDLKGESEYRRMIAEQAFTSESPEPEEGTEAESDLSKLEMIGEKMAQLLSENGFPTIASLAEVTLEELCEVPGIGPKRAQLLIDAADSYGENALEEEEPSEENEPSPEPEVGERADSPGDEDSPEKGGQSIADHPPSEVAG